MVEKLIWTMTLNTDLELSKDVFKFNKTFLFLLEVCFKTTKQRFFVENNVIIITTKSMVNVFVIIIIIIYFCCCSKL